MSGTRSPDSGREGSTIGPPPSTCSGTRCVPGFDAGASAASPTCPLVRPDTTRSSRSPTSTTASTSQCARGSLRRRCSDMPVERLLRLARRRRLLVAVCLERSLFRPSRAGSRCCRSPAESPSWSSSRSSPPRAGSCRPATAAGSSAQSRRAPPRPWTAAETPTHLGRIPASWRRLRPCVWSRQPQWAATVGSVLRCRAVRYPRSGQRPGLARRPPARRGCSVACCPWSTEPVARPVRAAGHESPA